MNLPSLGLNSQEITLILLGIVALAATAFILQTVLRVAASIVRLVLTLGAIALLLYIVYILFVR